MFALQFALLESYVYIGTHDHPFALKINGWKAVNYNDPLHYYFWLAVVSLYLY